MNVTVDLENDCPEFWVPTAGQCEAWLRGAAESSQKTDPSYVSIRVVGEIEAAELNRNVRDKYYAPNVLSFPADFPESQSQHLEYDPLGDIVLCASIVASEAHQQHKSMEAHWAHLVVHGYLHLLGYDHEEEEQAVKMEILEIQVLEKLGFPNPYLIG